MTFNSHRARKRFGQHWLKDEGILNRIIKSALLEDKDSVLEVGPGRGALTEKLVQSNASNIHCIEIDKDLVEGLRKRFENNKKLTFQSGDILSDLLEFREGILPNKVVANIPYNITGPLLDKLLGSLSAPTVNPYELLVLLMQREVAERILAKPGQSSFSALSVRIQLLADCSSVCLVPPRCFQPPPKVVSQVIKIVPFLPSQRIDPVLALRVESFLKTAFRSRRKMLRNTLVNLRPLPELEKLAHASGINLSQRPQELAPSSWLALAEIWN